MTQGRFRSVLSVGVVFWMLMLLTGVGFADAITRTTVTQVVDSFVVSGCTEPIAVNGTIEMVLHTTIDSNGGYHFDVLFHPQGITGVGLTTGTTYHLTGEARTSFNSTSGAFESSFVHNFNVIGPGPDNNSMVHETVHVTVNANGEVTAVVDNSSVTCR